MRNYLKLILILAIFLLPSSIAQGQEYKLDTFIDDFVSRPFSIEDISDDRVLTAQSFLCKLSKRDLRLIRNAIFASHGYIFKDPELREFFSSKKWYKPTIEDISELDLSSEEDANIKYIKDLESDPSFGDFLKLFKKSKLPITITPKKNSSGISKDFTLPP